VERWVRAALAGAGAAACWALAEQPARRVFGTGDYGDVRLLGRVAAPGRLWPAAGLAAHLLNGAAFGVVFDRLGRRGWRQGLLAAQAENLALWPVMAVMDRVHPDRRDGHWPRLATNGPIATQEAAMHALFGVLLGLLHDRLVPARRAPRPPRPAA
jgi:hypothetical protein